MNRARDRSSVGVSGGCESSWCAREWWAGNVVVGEGGGKGEPAPRQVQGG